MKDYYGTRPQQRGCRKRLTLARALNATVPLAQSYDGSMDSSIDPSIDPTAALAPSLVGHPARHRATVGRWVVIRSRLEAGLRRAARQVDSLALGAGKPLE